MAAQVGPGAIVGGDFRVEAPIGAGGFGSVFRATQLSTGRARALKVLHPQLVTDASSRRRFLEEAKIGGRVGSGHVVEVIASGYDPDAEAPWLAMELLDGEDLEARVDQGGPIAWPAARTIFAQLAHGLGAAHEQGIVHRDLKPANLFLCRPRHHGGEVLLKILDFGIAKSLDAGRTAGTATSAIGSPSFMAPEQGAEGASIRPATDVWALGLIAFYTLTGKEYWKSAHGSRNLQAIFAELLVEPIEAPSLRARGLGATGELPAGFDAWFAACVDRDPKRRFTNARGCLNALDRLLAEGRAGLAYEPTLMAHPAVQGAPAAPSPTPSPGTPSPPPSVARTSAPLAATAPLAPSARPAPPAVAPTAALDPSFAPGARPPSYGGAAPMATHEDAPAPPTRDLAVPILAAVLFVGGGLGVAGYAAWSGGASEAPEPPLPARRPRP